SDPAGHGFGKRVAACAPPDPDNWSSCPTHCHGLDLFHHGYYWEAHEEWESLWHACGRRGTLATFFKALIQLAVAGVKVREGKPSGVITHAFRGAELLRAVLADLPPNTANFMGVNLSEWIDHAEAIARQPPQVTEDARRAPVV